jgi:hypothetical protein
VNSAPQALWSRVEEYAVNLDKVSVLELEIEPDVGRGGQRYCSPDLWRVR